MKPPIATKCPTCGAIQEHEGEITKEEFLALYRANSPFERMVYTKINGSRYRIVDDATLSVLVEDLELPVRAAHFMHYAKIKTIGDLLRWSEDDLRRVPNLGKVSIQRIKEELARYGRDLPSQSLR